MSQTSSSSTFQALFNAALQDYEDKTEISLIDHPLAKQLETCNSVHSIIAILQDQARSFREFRGNDGRLMKSLKSLVDVLCSPSIGSTLNPAIGLVVRPKSFIGHLVSDGHSTAISACESNIRWHRHPTRRMSLFLLFHLHIPLTFKSLRRPKKCALATTRWLTFLRPSRISSADLVFIPRSHRHHL